MRAIEPQDVYARMGRLLGELELIRLEMGRYKDLRRALQVKNAAPREVFFEAVAMLRKIERLRAEIVHDEVEAAPLDSRDPVGLAPSDVLRVVETALARLAEIKTALGILEEAQEATPAGQTPSEVLGAISLASRQLNLLLEQPFRPVDVLSIVAAALRSSAQLLSRYGESLPALPPFVRRKSPADVYQLLCRCFESLHAVIATTGLRSLEIVRTFAGEEPSDVYDMAFLLLSELGYLQAQRPGAPPLQLPEDANGEARCFPAHVYQQALRLRAALEVLDRASRARPEVLRAG